MQVLTGVPRAELGLPLSWLTVWRFGANLESRVGHARMPLGQRLSSEFLTEVLIRAAMCGKRRRQGRAQESLRIPADLLARVRAAGSRWDC